MPLLKRAKVTTETARAESTVGTVYEAVRSRNAVLRTSEARAWRANRAEPQGREREGRDAQAILKIQQWIQGWKIHQWTSILLFMVFFYGEYF